MSLTPGTRLGPYEVLAPIGAGGMGEVWKARDTRLDRTVAIKVSQGRFSERFAREARAAAALNHPNVCQLYDVGPDYLVMEYVDGAPVAAPDTPRKLLDIAVQASDGLAAAHAAGIVHRDLKPDNILVTRDGRVKILDFGLAKQATEDVGAEDATRTMEQAITDPGTTVGTIAYMSPEQARGQAQLTAQSDQFSLGLVLYELASGKRAFRRDSAAETMAAIIREEVEPLPTTVPAPLRWIVARLLAKEPGERYDSTRDLYRDLRQLREGLYEMASGSAITAGGEGLAGAGRLLKRRWFAGACAAAGAGLGGGAVALLMAPAAADLSGYRFTPLAREEGTKRSPAWSPDGKSIAYMGSVRGIAQIFTKALDGAETSRLTHATEPCGPPFWSPDGSTIYYESGRRLWAVAASGGTSEAVLADVSDVALHPDGKTLIFRRAGKWWAGTLRGETTRELGQIPAGRRLTYSPDGRKLLMFARGEIWVIPWPAGTPRRFLLPDVNDGGWLPDSRHIVVSTGLGDSVNNTLSLVDPDDGAREVIYRGTYTMRSPAVSPDGRRLAYGGGVVEWGLLEISIPEGRVRAIAAGDRVSWLPDWAPSGTHYLFSTNGTGSNRAILDRSPAEGISRHVADALPSRESFSVYAPRWAPDGSRFLFIQLGEQGLQLTIANVAGGRWTPLAETDSQTSHTWSPDGEWVAFQRRGKEKSQLVKMRPAAGAVPVVLEKAAMVPFTYCPVEWSPSGEWIAYPSAAGVSLISPDGRLERPLTNLRLSTYAFSKDGATVYGITRNPRDEGAEWQLHAIDVKTGANKVLAAVELPPSTEAIAGFSLHPDGRRVLTSVGKWQNDIWMLEGFHAPPKSLFDRLLHH